MNLPRWHPRIGLQIVTVAGCLLVFTSPAQMITDGTVGTAAVLSGPDFAIPDSLGTTRGNNLFHSFSQFNLASGESASFSGPANIQNIISRVTGGSSSMIDGLVRSEIVGANLYLLNPAGIIFGPNAQVDVSGSFAASTGHYLKLADDGRFDAANPANDLLTSAPPSAFGFLDVPIAPITVESAFLGFPEGQAFSLIGGDVTLRGTFMTLPSGSLDLIAIQSAGELAWQLGDFSAQPDTAAFARLGQVTIEGSSFIDLSGDPSGRLLVEADNYTILDFSSVFGSNYGADAGRGFRFHVRDRFLAQEGSHDLIAFADGASGDIQVNATAVVLRSGGVATATLGEGAAGDITITASESFSAPELGSVNAVSGGPGPGGTIRITAPVIELAGGSAIGAFGTDTGPGGNLELVADLIRLEDGAFVSSEAFGSGDGGSIRLIADRIEINSASQVRAATLDTGLGGSIQVIAQELIIDAEGNISFLTGLQTEAGGSGPAGDIRLEVDQLIIQGMAELSSKTFFDADGGSILITGETVLLDGGARLTTSAGGTGAGGMINLNMTESITLQDGALITASSEAGNAGNIHLVAGQGVTLSGSEISTAAAVDGGNVKLTAAEIVYLLHSKITAAADQNGGNVTIDPVFVILDNSIITANAIFGSGGNILIVSDYFLTSASQVTASSEFGVQGSVAITAPDANLTGSILPLSASLVDAETLLRPICAVRLPGGLSSFVVVGAGGVPPSARDLLPDLLLENPDEAH